MSKLKQSFLTIAIGLILAAGISYAWTGPTANPPLENAPAPINVSVLGQIKTGALQVNGFRNIGSSIFDGLAEFKSNVGIGTNNPQAKLEVVGKIKISDDAVSPVAGAIRWTGSDFEGYNGTKWLSFTKDETGGGAVLSGEKVFTSRGTFTVPTGVTKVYVDIVGGGGGGGGGFLAGGDDGFIGGGGGGGGAGGFMSKEISVTPGQIIPVKIAAGGAGGPLIYSIYDYATSAGGGSSFFGGIEGRGGAGGSSGLSGGGGSNGGAGGTNGANGTGNGPEFNYGAAKSGNGGSSYFGTGGSGGSLGSGFGSGGGGGLVDGWFVNDGNGGNGAPGYVKVKW